MYRKLKKLICIGIDPFLVGTRIALAESPGDSVFLYGRTNKKSIQQSRLKFKAV